ncbi:MAG: hypothetical protein AAF996_10685 [Pseudomonadota bacterium]
MRLRKPFLKQRTWIALRLREISAYFSDVTASRVRARKKVLIFAQGRSGTTLLESLLVSTGHFIGMGEPLHTFTRQVWFPVNYIRGLGRGSGSNLVVHVKGSQLVRERRKPVDPAGFLKRMQEDGWTIIHVLRKCVADQVLSECVAKHRGSYHKQDDLLEGSISRIEPEEFLERYRRRLDFGVQDAKALSAVAHLSFVYEDDLRDPIAQQATVDEICTKLHFEPRPVRTNLRRIANSDPSAKLKNYEEIVDYLSAHGFGWN